MRFHDLETHFPHILHTHLSSDTGYRNNRLFLCNFRSRHAIFQTVSIFIIKQQNRYLSINGNSGFCIYKNSRFNWWRRENRLRKAKNRSLSVTKPDNSRFSRLPIFVKKGGFDWWRRGESNSCPKALLHGSLRAQSVI